MKFQLFLIPLFFLVSMLIVYSISQEELSFSPHLFINQTWKSLLSFTLALVGYCFVQRIVERRDRQSSQGAMLLYEESLNQLLEVCKQKNEMLTLLGVTQAPATKAQIKEDFNKGTDVLLEASKTVIDLYESEPKLALSLDNAEIARLYRLKTLIITHKTTFAEFTVLREAIAEILEKHRR